MLLVYAVEKPGLIYREDVEQSDVWVEVGEAVMGNCIECRKIKIYQMKIDELEGRLGEEKKERAKEMVLSEGYKNSLNKLREKLLVEMDGFYSAFEDLI
jgi:hypothetical protein